MFLNREDAGNKLAKALKEYKLKHPLVLGIPRGGVEVGYHVAVELNSDFDIIVIRKLGHPQQPEAAFGALAEDGSLYLDPWSKKYLTKDMIENVIAREKKEIRRRIKTYREGEELPDLKGRTIILVDDGIATGSTVFAAINMCRKLNPRKLIVAAPVSARSQVSKLAVKADEVVVLDKKRNLMAVSQAYKNFANLSDNEVTHFMNQWRQKTGKKISSDH
jgi:predicted phosphoribosyltransferase